MKFPENLLYSKDHEWILIEGKTAKVGISDFAQQELGDIVYIEIDKLDEKVEANDTFGSVEAVKTVSDLFLPVSGEIIEFNEELESSPEKVNESPYEDGWIVKISIEDEVDTSSLMNSDEYQKHIGV